MKEHKRKAEVYYSEQLAGIIEETEQGYKFTYNADFIKNGMPVSISLPLRKEPFESSELFSFFAGLLPEGWYLDIVSKSTKTDKNDKFGLLLATCKDTIGTAKIMEIK